MKLYDILFKRLNDIAENIHGPHKVAMKTIELEWHRYLTDLGVEVLWVGKDPMCPMWNIDSKSESVTVPNPFTSLNRYKSTLRMPMKLAEKIQVLGLP